MDLMYLVAWLVYPYTVAAIFGMGIVWHYDAPNLFEDTKPRSSFVLLAAVKIFWLLTTVTGIWLLVFYKVSDDLPHMFDWLIGFLHFQPNMDLIKETSVLLQIHLFLLFTFLLFFSFTKYVTMLFLPLRLIKAIIKLRRPTVR